MFVEAEDVECGVRTGVPSLSDTPPLLCFAGLACAFVCTPDGPLQSPRWWLKGKPYQRLEPLRDNPKGTGTGVPVSFHQIGPSVRRREHDGPRGEQHCSGTA